MNVNPTTTGGYALACLLAAAAAALVSCARPARPPPEIPPGEIAIGVKGAFSEDARRYRIVPERSLVTVLAFRGGALASAGHDHLIASRDLAGEVVLEPGLAGSAFALAMPVRSLSVDDPELREAQGGRFTAPIPDAARRDTRANMLGPEVLDAARFALVSMRSHAIEPHGDGALATVDVTVRDHVHRLEIPLRYTLEGSELTAHGEFAVRQSELGLEPFSVLLGALKVEDEVAVRFEVAARAD